MAAQYARDSGTRNENFGDAVSPAATGLSHWPIPGDSL